MKPAILLYNPPAILDKISWVRNLPLNLLSICSLIDEQQFDINIEQGFAEEALSVFRPYLENAVCLGISCMTGIQISHGLELAKLIRTTRPDLPIVWGGYHPTATPEQTLQSDFVDIVVRGYGEITFSKLVQRIVNNQSYTDIKGISFSDGDKIVNNPDSEIPDFDDIPALPYHLCDVERVFTESHTRMLSYISSRGCPHRCGFCADRVIYKSQWNPLSAQRILSDFERLKENYDYDTIRFFDSNMFVDEERIREVCEGVIEKKLSFNWLKCNGDAYNLAKYSSETLQLMRKAGVSNVLLGFESGYEPALQCISKAATLEQNLNVVKQLHEHRINIGFSFMFGFPYDLPIEKLKEEHKKELNATMKVISELSEHYLPGDYYLLFPFTPYPGVKLFSRYQKLGYVPPDSLKAWSATNLNESNSCSWVAPSLLKHYSECLKMNWIFMHKLDRSIFMGIQKSFIRKYAAFCDKLASNIIKRRIDRNQLSFPAILNLILIYFGIRNNIRTKGWKVFAKKVCFKIRHRG